MQMLLRILVAIWAIGSIVIGVIAFAVVLGTQNDIAAAAYEGVETIPEAIFAALGQGASPLWADIGYWLLMAVAAFLAFRRAR